MIKHLSLFLVLGCIPLLSHAQADEWQCSAQDSSDKEWIRKSPYERMAINLAFEACKKESAYPSTCHSAKNGCEAFIGGQSTRPLWRCTALDQLGKAWESNLYRQRDDAALAAKAYCLDNSGSPDTCYINLMTCRNLNELN